MKTILQVRHTSHDIVTYKKGRLEFMNSHDGFAMCRCQECVWTNDGPSTSMPPLSSVLTAQRDHPWRLLNHGLHPPGSVGRSRRTLSLVHLAAYIWKVEVESILSRVSLLSLCKSSFHCQCHSTGKVALPLMLPGCFDPETKSQFLVCT